MSVNVINVRGRAEIGDRSYDIVEAHVSYALDTVPTGRVCIPVGARISAKGGETLKAMPERTPIKVFAFDETGKEKLIGKGYTVSPSQERSFSSAGFTIGFVGWLDDMRATSALSAKFTPSTGDDVVRPAYVRGDKANDSSPDAASYGENYVPDVERDIAQATLDALKELATLPLLAPVTSTLLDDAAITAPGGDQRPGTDNTLALQALPLISTFPIIPPSDENLLHKIARTLGSVVFSPAGGRTAWSKLGAMADLFGFMIVPAVEKAICAPVGLFGPAEVLIGADEYMVIQKARQTPYPVRGVALIGPIADRTGSQSVMMPAGAADMGAGLAGWFDAQAAGIGTGMFETVRAPAWLTNELGVMTQYSKASSGVTGGGVQGHGPAPDEDTVPDIAQAEADTKSVEIGDALAWWKWLEMTASLRTAAISGKLRYDIGPGTPVRIASTGNLLENGKDDTGFVVATVYEVSIDINANAPSAATSFKLIGVRPESDDPVVKVHPMWGTPFPGMDIFGNVVGAAAAESGDAQELAGTDGWTTDIAPQDLQPNENVG